RSLRDKLREIIAAGIADGSFEQADPKLLVTMMNAAISWVLRMYRPGGKLSGKDFADQATNYLVKGMLTGGPSRASKSSSANASPATGCSTKPVSSRPTTRSR